MAVGRRGGTDRSSVGARPDRGACHRSGEAVRPGCRWPGPPPAIGPSDRMRWAVVMAGAADPLRADLRPEAVTRTARRVAASMVACWRSRPVPPAGTGTVTAGRPTAVTGHCRWCSTTAGSDRLDGRSPDWPGADPFAQRAGPGRQRRPGADGRPRAGHLHHGRADGRLDPGRRLRRPAGRTRAPSPDRCTGGPASWPTPCWPTPSATAPSGPSTTPCAGRACCPASVTRSTRTATPASRCSSTCSSMAAARARRTGPVADRPGR